ncbi:bifunctional riboflavin kinase/FAD synthetase [Eikenella sp. S3360]|uniref:Riboflavin biosynthesis protein n=1 Tax=Eikenella glucosivorans TaxID=2766967 RepID=A0ABS0N7Y9_9NEIS|nr:bifunctional riboflavin kinase/FAD synthetase [Eikenella glucosivorans]MBH5328417.1 bifunctional riboflavin kinase/FAD synthetase [Eikenella glucosivorans]
MNIRFGNTAFLPHPHGSAVTIGNFDGVHLGHRHILERLRREADARGLAAVAIVFEPQPQEFFSRQRGAKQPFRLTPLREKLRLLRDTGCLDAVWALRFNAELSAMPAPDFIQKLLLGQLNTRYLLIGDDFRFGAGRQGDFELLRRCPEMDTESTPSVMVQDVRASSTLVRQALSEGRLAYAESLLGHRYSLIGRVKHGAKLGRTIGSPTANIHLPPHRYPLGGVFAVAAHGAFGSRPGVASFGLNPTVSDLPTQKLEVHLFDFTGNLYGQRLRVDFLHKLRDEQKFSGLPELQAQIAADMAEARGWLARHPL